MCTLLKFRHAKFGVYSLLFSNVIEENPFGVRLDPPPPPLVKEGLVKPSPQFWVGLNSKFCYAPLLFFNSSLVIENFLLKFYFCQKLARKNLWGISLTSPRSGKG